MNGLSNHTTARSAPDLTRTCRNDVHVLVPGAGLGRLAYDIAKLGKPALLNGLLLHRCDTPQLGFTCQGNEFSLFMLLTSSFILNRFRFHSNILTFTHKKKKEQRRSINTCYTPTFTRFLIPRKQVRCSVRSKFLTCSHRTSQMGPTSLWSQVKAGFRTRVWTKLTIPGLGDFEEIYGGPDEDNKHINQWDAIVTCFFIDTVCRSPRSYLSRFIYDLIEQAKNIVNYLRTFHKILAPGGVWINLGDPSFARRKSSGTESRCCRIKVLCCGIGKTTELILPSNWTWNR